MTATPRHAAATILSSIDRFTAASHSPLRPYQSECAAAIIRSVVRGEGKTFTVMYARQVGKNELSARLEAYLLALFAGRGGNMVKAAPSFKPQIVNSMLRLRQTMDASPVLRDRWRPAFGYIYQVGRASCTFLSADASANVVGATASLLLEIDEAQDVDPDKYTRDFRPMASSTNATTVMYGTAWAMDTLLEQQKRTNLEHEQRTGERLHWEYDWTALAAISENYRRFVEGEIQRMGIDHPSIKTQYLLQCIADAGRLFSEEQKAKMRGNYNREKEPTPGTTYIAGIDIAGADEEAEDAAARALKPRRDSTVITIARLERTPNGEPVCRVVETIWWTGRHHEDQLAAINALWQRWQFACVVVDASGIGYGLAQLLERQHPDGTVPFTFTAASKSKLGYETLAMINTGRLTVFADDHSAESNELWWELNQTRYEMRAQETMRWSIPPSEGHDDFVVSLALCAHAATHAPVRAAGGILRPPSPASDGEVW